MQPKEEGTLANLWGQERQAIHKGWSFYIKARETQLQFDFADRCDTNTKNFLARYPKVTNIATFINSVP